MPHLCYWEPFTATVDWCEDNCVYSPYIVEFWNSLSNFMYILLAFAGLYNCSQLHLPWRFWIINFLLIIIGVGSLMFHATLSSLGQIMDETPMVAAVTWFLLVILCVNQKANRKAIATVSVCGIAMLVSLFLRLNPLYFQVPFAVIVLATAIYGYISLSSVKAPVVKRVFLGGVSLWLLALSVWITDYRLCSFVTQLRPRDLFQLHAWWHVLTALGTYCMIVALIHFHFSAVEPRHRVDGKEVLPNIVFKLKGLLPWIVLEEVQSKPKGKATKQAK